MRRLYQTNDQSHQLPATRDEIPRDKDDQLSHGYMLTGSAE